MGSGTPLVVAVTVPLKVTGVNAERVVPLVESSLTYSLNSIDEVSVPSEVRSRSTALEPGDVRTVSESKKVAKPSLSDRS